MSESRKLLIYRAVNWFDFKFPKQLTSGVMFFEGERITVFEFMTVVRETQGGAE